MHELPNTEIVKFATIRLAISFDLFNLEISRCRGWGWGGGGPENRGIVFVATPLAAVKTGLGWKGVYFQLDEKQREELRVQQHD